MLIDELSLKKDQILFAAQKYGANHLKIFGSVIRREETKESDVDILVSFPEGYDMFSQRLPLQEELENIIGRHVDLVVHHEMNKYIKDSIIENAKSL